MVSGNQRTILSREYAVDVLLFLNGKKEVQFGDFSDIVKSGTTRKELLLSLEQVELVTIRKIERPRKTYFVSLTPLGSSIAADLKRADDRLHGIDPPEDIQTDYGTSSDEGDTVRE